MLRPSVLIMFAIAALAMPPATAEELSPLARSIQSDLDRLESRVTTSRDDTLQSDRLQRTARDRGRAARLTTPTPQRSAQDIALSSDLSAAQQDLRTLKTREPNARSTPVLERNFDRIRRQSRGSGLYRPSPSRGDLYRR
ncbi:MAG: hypothetical protein AAF637_21735 [Pseudomonadota bacterium]